MSNAPNASFPPIKSAIRTAGDIVANSDITIAIIALFLYKSLLYVMGVSVNSTFFNYLK